MIIAISILFVVYFSFIIALIIGFHKQPKYSAQNIQHKIQFSIIIPFRNEAKNLPALLKSISQLNYPHDLFEIIFVNDASEDSSAEIILNSIDKSTIPIHLFQNKRYSNSPKKDALSVGILNSNYDWIATTDADCEVPRNWLGTIDSFIQNSGKKESPKMICGPVQYKTDGSFIQDFQLVDGLSLQSVSIGSFGLNNPILNNGANLIYLKDAFSEVKGFSGNDHIASGDDIFLMEKFKKSFPEHVVFLKSDDAIVYTTPQPSWKDLINQRIRWASKTSKQKNTASQVLGLVVFLVNIGVLAIPFLLALDSKNLIIYIPILILKIVIDFIFIGQSADFFNKRISFFNFLGMFYIYSILIVIIVFGSLKGRYSWKGRRF